ncbi:hypothetical protein EVB87_175 [Rhizobium phage RHph_N28_1]|nr:hypothetical protein EVB87_175 [Rhizobium phage RHph_N28_1]QIG74204.1 hypothetical protein EVC07_176 [Rhizobium phage RHph_N42]QIG74811.1 hypothetical protein EVC12_176 [Rhizobium phage RHph_I42]QXV73863.1 hypothetical protein [Rhizobium phage RHph_N46]
MFLYVVYFNSAIGFLLEAVFVFYLLKEIWRAWRQAWRVATVHARCRTGRRKATWREFRFTFRLELFGRYDALRIGRLIIPYNPNHKITRYQIY